MVKKIIQWFNKKPATKATWIAAVCSVVSLIFVFFQTIIINKQTILLEKQTEISQAQFDISREQINMAKEQLDISKEQTEISLRQTKISERQTLLLSHQIESSINPHVEINLRNGNGKKGIDKLVVFNKGNYAIKNIQVIPIYFGHVQEHGWYASIGSNPIYSEDLDRGKKWHLNISFFPSFFKDPPMADIFKPDEEYLNILVIFERGFDGKSYLSILPGSLFRDDGDLEWWSMSMAVNGPLSKICDRSLELTYDFLQRKPFSTDYEIYNSNFLLGYKPTGCLGEIKWVQ